MARKAGTCTNLTAMSPSETRWTGLVQDAFEHSGIQVTLLRTDVPGDSPERVAELVVPGTHQLITIRVEDHARDAIVKQRIRAALVAQLPQ
jgi:hypothetical protein